MLEDRLLDLGGFFYYLYEDIEVQGGGLGEVVFKGGVIVFLLFYFVLVIKVLFIVLFIKVGR